VVSRAEAMGRGKVLAKATMFDRVFSSISTQWVSMETGYDFVFEGVRGVVEHHRDDHLRAVALGHVHVHV
jgi:hypothetical protein